MGKKKKKERKRYKVYETVALKTLDTTCWKAMVFEDRTQNEPRDCFRSPGHRTGRQHVGRFRVVSLSGDVVRSPWKPEWLD